jgi:hypothetical protein
MSGMGASFLSAPGFPRPGDCLQSKGMMLAGEGKVNAVLIPAMSRHSPSAFSRFDHFSHFLIRDRHVVHFLRVLHGHLDNLFFIVALHGKIAGRGTLDFFHLLCHGSSPPDKIRYHYRFVPLLV